MNLSRTFRYYGRRFLRLLLQRNDSPRQIAGGVAIGTFVGSNPTVISQMGLSIILTTLFRCSRLPAIAMCYLSNPLTAVPIYGGGYLIGMKVVGLFGMRPASYEQVKLILKRMEDSDKTGSFIRETGGQLLNLGWRGLVTMEVGATIMGILLAVPMYWIALRVVTGHRLIKAQRAAERAQRRLERIRLREEAERAAAATQRAEGIRHE